MSACFEDFLKSAVLVRFFHPTESFRNARALWLMSKEVFNKVKQEPCFTYKEWKPIKRVLGDLFVKISVLEHFCRIWCVGGLSLFTDKTWQIEESLQVLALRNLKTGRGGGDDWTNDAEIEMIWPPTFVQGWHLDIFSRKRVFLRRPLVLGSDNGRRWGRGMLLWWSPHFGVWIHCKNSLFF